MKTLRVQTVLNKAKSVRYLRPVDYNRAIALTRFVKWLESEAKAKDVRFGVISASVHKLVLRSSDEIQKREVRGFYKFVNFVYGRNIIYIQFDSNPFFDTSYINIRSLDDTEKYFMHDKGIHRTFRVETLDMFNVGEKTSKTF